MFNIVRVVAGLALLTLGRKLFWLFVAAVGFAFGFFLASRLVPRQGELVQLAIALSFGVIGALLAVFLQKVAIYVGGFLAGGSILVNLLEILGIRPAPGSDFFLSIIIFIVGGIVGAILVRLIFDWALIILSSLAGAGLIARDLFASAPVPDTVIFATLFVVGVVIQAVMLRRERE